MNLKIESHLSPAKINLFLHILRRRADGYHELQTLFQLLDYGDELTFKTDSNGTLELHQESADKIRTLPYSQNLIIKAARLLRRESGDPKLGVKIYLNKRIPAGAGLGGGSSNAATTLKTLNKLWDCDLSMEELKTLALKLGADVPFFLEGKSAWGEGLGEKLQPVELEKNWFAVVTPNCSVSTSHIFSNENLTRNTQAIKMADFLAGGAKNDCEPVTRSLYPEVDEAFCWLQGHADTRMTGTGSSVFAKFQKREQAEGVLEMLPNHMRGFVAEGINSLSV